jgi:hypothetical protein
MYVDGERRQFGQHFLIHVLRALLLQLAHQAGPAVPQSSRREMERLPGRRFHYATPRHATPDN